MQRHATASRAALLSAALLAAAPAVANPQPAPGDRWLYQGTYRDMATPGAPSRTRLVRVAVQGTNVLGKPILGGDILGFGMHSDTCLVDVLASEELAGEVACGAPLAAGQRWHGAHAGRFRDLEQWFDVTGTEPVEVGGATHVATVIRTSRPVFPPSPRIASRRSTYHYVPALKGMTSIVHELLDQEGAVQLHESMQMLRFTPAGQAAPDGP